MFRKIFFMIALLFCLPLTAMMNPPQDKMQVNHHLRKISYQVSREEPFVVIRLPANASTGYSWFLLEDGSPFIQQIVHERGSHNDSLLGSGEEDLWTVKFHPSAFDVPRVIRLNFLYSRPWENEAENESLSSYPRLCTVKIFTISSESQ